LSGEARWHVQTNRRAALPSTPFPADATDGDDSTATGFPTLPTEPTLESLPNRGLRYLLATRPGFLSVTLVAALIGLATAFASGITLNAATAWATVVFALVAHAGVNVMNDYYDALNGTDDLNTERIFPFTGGSRFIQNGVLGVRETFLYGSALLGLVAVGGIFLAWVSGPGLLIVGVLGLVIGWAYSAPPLMLNGRGLGEICVWGGFSLVAVGADFVQRGHFAAMPMNVTTSYALLVTNILFINQFPDKNADEAAGKRTWVVRLGPVTARWGYPLIAGLAYLWTVVASTRGVLPAASLIAILPALFSARAAALVLRVATRPRALAPAIQLSITAALCHGLLLALALGASKLLETVP